MNDPRHPPQPVKPAVAPPPLQPSVGHHPAATHHPAAHHPTSNHGVPMSRPASAIVDPLVATSHAQNHAPAPAKPHGHGHVEEPIELVTDEDPSAPLGANASSHDSHKKIVAFGAATHQFSEQFKRQTTKTGTGACRVKSFHGKYSDEGIRYLDNAINHWLDDHPDVEVKFVTPTVMTFEGKTREPALVLNLWY